MNSKKQIILLLFSWLFFFQSAEAMLANNDVKSNNVLELIKDSPRNNRLYYPVQLASIATLNCYSKNPNIIKVLAIFRMILNALYASVRVSSCMNDKRELSSIPFNIVKALFQSNLTRILCVLFAGQIARNVKKDYDVFKAADAIADKNGDSQHDITRKQQFFMALWLTANNLLPSFINNILRASEKTFSESKAGSVWFLLAEFSELYRQQIMYKMMKKEKLVAAY